MVTTMKEQWPQMKTKFFYFTLAVLATLVITGCGKKQGSETSEQRATSAPAATIDPSTAGFVTGTVTLDGTPPVLKPINMSAEPCCQKAHSGPVVPPEVVTGEKGVLANVVAYIRSGLGDHSFETPKDPVTLNQQGCMYDPHVVARMAGRTLGVKNTDQTTHNIHPMPKDNREWNKSQPAGAAPMDDSFARGELAIPVKCNPHPWMKSYIYVLKNPYFAVTSRTGPFELENLLSGMYTIGAWQEKYGTAEQTVTIGPKESKAISLTFKAAGSSGD
jgi:plastocyanin